MKLLYNNSLIRRARELRSNMTDAERRLWLSIRMKQLKGYQFFRQKPLGNYIVDFYCPKARLVIEVDGGQHYMDKGLAKDRKRDDFLRSMDLKVLRFSDSEVLNNMEGVAERLLEELP